MGLWGSSKFILSSPVVVRLLVCTTTIIARSFVFKATMEIVKRKMGLGQLKNATKQLASLTKIQQFFLINTP